jgi:hypothetical protein
MSRLPLRWAVAVWVIIVSAVGARIVLKPHSNTVFPIYADAGCNWLAGHDLYRPPKSGLDQFRYFPAIAAAFAPCTLLPLWLGEVLWRLLNVATFLAGLAAWARWQWGHRTNLAAMMVLVVPLAVGSFNNGQCNLLLTGLLLGAATSFAAGRWAFAAAAISVASLFKGYPLALGLLLVLVEPRRFAPRLLVAVGVGLALPFLFQDAGYIAGQYRALFARLGTENRSLGDISRGYRDAQLLLRNIGLPISLEAYRIVEVIAGASCAAVVIRMRTAGNSRPAVWACPALGLCWMTLFGPSTESSTYVLVAPILAQAVINAREQPPGRRWLAYTSYAVFTLSMMGAWLPPAWNGRIQALGVQPAAAGLLFACVLLECNYQRKRASGVIPEARAFADAA